MRLPRQAMPPQTTATLISLAARRSARNPVSILDRFRRTTDVETDPPGTGINASEVDYPNADATGYEGHLDHPAVTEWSTPRAPRHRTKHCWCGEEAAVSEINTIDGSRNREVCGKHATPGIFGVVPDGAA